MRLIDADNLKAELFDANWLTDNDEHMVEEIVERQSTVDAEPVRHAKYIHVGPSFKGGADWYRCSNCGTLESGVYVQYPFCSICGAKMDEGEQDATD